MDLSKATLLDIIRRLIQDGDLLVWDPRTKNLHGSEAIAGASMNGNAIQISLTEHDCCPECGSESEIHG